MKREMWSTVSLVTGVLVLAVGGPWLVREIRELPGHRALAARSEQRIVTLEVSGMTCKGCAAKVQAELSAVSGVAEAQVRLGQDRAYVVCDRALADSSLLGAVHRAGPGFLAAVVNR
jgi:copper chaperone CopZ